MKKAIRVYLSSMLVAAACSAPFVAPAVARDSASQSDYAPRQIAEALMPVYETGKKLPKGMAESSVSILISAEPTSVWNTLLKFEDYGKIFKRIQTSEVTKRDGELVYVETCLKPQMFVKNQIQHTVTNVSTGPNRLHWKQLDGNFKYCDGTWNMAAVNGGKTNLTYTLHIDCGSLVPPSMVSFFLKFVQKEVVAQLKHYVERDERTKETVRVSNAKTSESTVSAD